MVRRGGRRCPTRFSHDCLACKRTLRPSCDLDSGFPLENLSEDGHSFVSAMLRDGRCAASSAPAFKDLRIAFAPVRGEVDRQPRGDALVTLDHAVGDVAASHPVRDPADDAQHHRHHRAVLPDRHLAAFDVVAVLTQGGPLRTTQVLATYAFTIGILSGDMPLGASVSLFMLPFLAVAAIFILRGVIKRGSEV